MIASSGAGRVEHFHEVFTATEAESALAAGIFHRREVPIWESYAPGLFGDPGADYRLLLRLLALALGVGWLLGLVILALRRRQ